MIKLKNQNNTSNPLQVNHDQTYGLSPEEILFKTNCVHLNVSEGLRQNQNKLLWNMSETKKIIFLLAKFTLEKKENN